MTKYGVYKNGELVSVHDSMTEAILSQWDEPGIKDIRVVDEQRERRCEHEESNMSEMFK